ncbi:unnamed protein product [Rotaria sp. Silwood2]|nr:unnamed protein product [Rotaria sp. Silwood2]CAF2510829.1 unnamed protein product [Rotaria sp. Silwood2]CAF2743142.1 unnamed protein product [Rotaria sp. Silwood2]CAF2885530.1 unnamed protein product [Rotaria sp. Silwood2]CAF3911054.1 unnamed protein product [Rotaria sp. Silwood2]
MFISAPLTSIFVTLILYLFQGVILGLSTSIPIYLTSAGATWREQSVYNFVHYPFSFKLIWAPIIDVFYIRRFGRRQTWLLPIQLILGIILIILSFYIDSFISGLRMMSLTIFLFFIVFFTASQDVCVDGWALTLFSTSNVVWQSTSQTIGQTLGRFLGSSFLLTFESANFTNRYIRAPLSLQMQNTGLFTLAEFIRYWGIGFLIVTCIVAFLFRERTSNQKDDTKTLKLIPTYLSIIKLFKKRCMLELVFILIISPFGYAATYFMTNIALVSNGMSRETLGLITMPLVLVKIIVPLILSQTHRPLIWFARLYLPRLFICVLIGIYILFTSQLVKFPYIFYPILMTLFVINETIIYLQLVARVGFYAQISEPRIGGTYMTLVSTLGNIGQTLSSSAVLLVASWLPKKHAYSIEVAGCTVIGIVWLLFTWRMMRRLQALPIDEWYSVKENDKPREMKAREDSNIIPNTNDVVSNVG